MRRLLLVPALALALAATGSAGADTFSVVPSNGDTSAVLPAAAVMLPSAETPNDESRLVLPPDPWLPPAQPRELPLSALQQLWQSAGEAYNVPWPILASINKIESNFGRNMGPSSAGAVGWMQFMPDTWMRWGTDANGDGVANPWEPEDAIYSAARYLAAAGAAHDIYRAVFAYNHADWYVQDVLELAALYGSGGAEVTANLDVMQADLQAAEQAVAAASEALAAARDQLASAREAAQAVFRRVSSLEVAAQDEELLSARLDAQKQAVLAEGDTTAAAAEVATAEAHVGELEAALAEAEQALAAARQGTQAAAFAPGAATLLGAPQFVGRYVFPVGGGPSIVSVGANHHDYPAADIAAPQGAPVYAISDGVVERAWHDSDPRCGIGLTIRTTDGLAWTYCHLAYLDPLVDDGVAVTAGQHVGLVGSTGRSSGPHLHLQLQPATASPQQEAWFQSFAGSAYRWQDAAAPTQGPVFSVVAAPSDEGLVLFTR
jgi:murein DD-endopeptidase MepM/ murein hydrolase activator NlpD